MISPPSAHGSRRVAPDDFELNRPLRVDPKAVAIYSVRNVSHTNGPPPHGLPLFVIVRHGPKIEGGGGGGQFDLA
jgi:hypothetical protein